MNRMGFAVAGLLGLAACGGGAKQADAPTGSCPEGTVLHGSDCVPADTASHPSDDSSAAAAPPSDTSSAPATPNTPYDKESVEVELRKAARQVKANCGSATDDSGASPGPWGKTAASVTLGRNGHVKAVAVPAPYDGQPDGNCAVNAFKKIQFPPYANPSDVVVDWDIELVKPKH